MTKVDQDRTGNKSPVVGLFFCTDQAVLGPFCQDLRKILGPCAWLIDIFIFITFLAHMHSFTITLLPSIFMTVVHAPSPHPKFPT